MKCKSCLKKCEFSGNTRDKVYSLTSTTIKLVNFATKYLRKNSSLCVEIYDFLLGPEEEIAIPFMHGIDGIRTLRPDRL